ncbi:D-alanyl-D-alanine carboxypeptidase family protein [uncultured Anaerococcus sp.]|uniref:D-alanyl-D-alanine carboxypeptidase family protein n=1 Tax=uncultured Anaerococcus sp. TaxID=293428 RepID=UPI0025E7BD1E|nr:D-alanyl-D-alanine carboxypeptidase family protein [uncultured Anaerococcus sp.]
MKYRYKLLASLMAFLIFFMPISHAESSDKIVGLDDNVSAYLIANEETGEVYHEKNADEPMAMASLSKLMTFLIAKESIDNGDISLNTKVKADKAAEELTSWQYSALGVKEGEIYTVEELLEGLIAISGNDCAYLLANTISVSESAFAREMNEKAKELDLESQVYYNSSGVETEDGYQNTSSARDLFKLSQHIIKTHPEILEYSAIREIKDPSRDIDKTSTIPLMDEIKGVDGLKTGTTDEAGYCLISTVDMSKLDSKDDFRTIGVVMGADQKDTRDMVMSDLIYYVSKYYSLRTVLDTGVPIKSMKDITVKQGYIDLYPKEDIKMIIKEGENPNIRYNIKDDVKAPIKENEDLGEVEISYKDESHKIGLFSKKGLDKASLFTRVIRTIEDSCNFLLKTLIAR